MKTRIGFVSNSSSSSFILNIGKMEEIDFSEIIDWEYTRQDDTPIYNEEDINIHLNGSFSKCDIIQIKCLIAQEKLEYGDPLYNKIYYRSDYSKLYEEFKNEIDKLCDGTNFINEDCNYIIGEMDDHHKIEQLIHNRELYFKDNIDEYVISYH